MGRTQQEVEVTEVEEPQGEMIPVLRSTSLVVLQRLTRKLRAFSTVLRLAKLKYHPIKRVLYS